MLIIGYDFQMLSDLFSNQMLSAHVGLGLCSRLCHCEDEIKVIASLLR